MIGCDTCPNFKGSDKKDFQGYPYGICGISGNIVYQVPRKEKRIKGRGWIYYPISSCGLYETIEEAKKRSRK